ncbi:methyltransferase [Mycobacterium tuberculosis]|nr:methyltransferase [Mycobacterium tuberculosis]CKS53643.1 methyltransferase [Mycobacterium tuberculosis]COX23587.1 methyltransferase [Mycobacterium tuberculosis]CPB32564.1 methyltransferase [Mycobacterium tuberculosis]
MRYAPNAAAGNIGLTMFDRNAFVNLSRSAGLVDVEQ